MSELVLKGGEKQDIVIVHSSKESSSRIIRLVGEGAEVSVREIFLAPAESKIMIIHEAGRTKSRVEVRGVVKASEKALSHATVVIPKNAQLSDSFVSQKFLLLGKYAEAEAVPCLEIEANDVKAGHSAVVSPLDDEKLFYLMSRGLSEDSARKLMIESFLDLPEGYEL